MANIKYSPWGAVQTVQPVAEGITHVTTAGHGGYHLDAKRWKELMTLFPEFVPFNNNTGWLEEDCDANLLVFICPESTSDAAFTRVVKYVRNDPYFKFIPESFWESLWATEKGKKALEQL